MADEKRKGRKPNPSTGRRVNPMLPKGTHACLEYLVGLQGRYGANPNEVARYMIMREVDDLTRAGVIPKDLPQRSGA